MVMLSLQFLKYRFSDNSTYLLKCFLENNIFVRRINLGSGNSADVCEKGKCEGVWRLDYRDDDLQSFLKYFCGPGTLLKWLSYDTEETYFLGECS